MQMSAIYATGDNCQTLICSKSDDYYGCPLWLNTAYSNPLAVCGFANSIPYCPFTCGICQRTLA